MKYQFIHHLANYNSFSLSDSSDESSSRSGMEVDLPQIDGANDAPRVPAQMYQQMPPNQQQHSHNGNTHTRPTVIPILMPPGNW